MRPAIVTMAAWMTLLALPVGSATAWPLRRLTGERLSATVDGTSYFVPGACYSGGPATSSFTFTGTATGPYPGTYTETGTIAYKLHPATSGDLIASGPVTGFFATFKITSAAGTVTGTERLDGTLAADQDVECHESAGGTGFETSAFEPAYTATIRTARGAGVDRGNLTTTLSSFLALGGTVAGSAEDAALTSTERACHPPCSRPPSCHARTHGSRRRARRAHAASGARLTLSFSGYRCSASNSA